MLGTLRKTVVLLAALLPAMAQERTTREDERRAIEFERQKDLAAERQLLREPPRARGQSATPAQPRAARLEAKAPVAGKPPQAVQPAESAKPAETSQKAERRKRGSADRSMFDTSMFPGDKAAKAQSKGEADRHQ